MAVVHAAVAVCLTRAQFTHNPDVCYRDLCTVAVPDKRWLEVKMPRVVDSQRVRWKLDVDPDLVSCTRRLPDVCNRHACNVQNQNKYGPFFV